MSLHSWDICWKASCTCMVSILNWASNWHRWSKTNTSGPKRIPHALREEINTQIDSVLDHGIIQPSRSPWASPLVAVPKKDGGTRLCVDYRQLNTVTLKDAYPLPHIADTLEALSGEKYFSTMDLSSGYWQVGVHQDDQHKTAFTSHRGLFELSASIQLV